MLPLVEGRRAGPAPLSPRQGHGRRPRVSARSLPGEPVENTVTDPPACKHHDMTRARAAAAAGAVVAALGALSAVAAPAMAAEATVHDHTGDAATHGLDIVRATVRNLDHAVVVRVRFVRAVRGDLVVSVDPRRARGLRLVSEYRPVGHTRNLVVAGAFSDKADTGQTTPVTCPGYRVAWSADAPVVRLRLPAACLHDGNYGAIRFGVLTEDTTGSDSDYAPSPHERTAFSPWVPRG